LLFSTEFSWGEVVKTDLDKNEIDKIIKKYVDEVYPNKIKNYNNSLQKEKSEMILDIKNITFIEKNLMWQDTKVNEDLKLNRLELKVYCRKLNFAKRRDWRVPTYLEMISLIDFTKNMPASIQKVKYIKNSKYWTSSVSVLEKKKNWFVDFMDGTSGVDSDLVRHNIRCVREVSSLQGEY